MVGFLQYKYQCKKKWIKVNVTRLTGNQESHLFLISGNLSSCFPVQTLFGIEPVNANIKSQKSSKRFEANVEETLSSEELFEPFEFLAIGTFGIEPLNAGPPTPTLPAPFEKVTNQQTQTEVTANDLKLINYEIEKFLEAEEKGKTNNTSERNGQENIIIHSNKPIEGGMQVVACPLQKYLFATSIELAETDTEIRKEKTSLGELFKRNDAVNDPIMKCEEAELLTNKGKVAHIMKKVVKKFHSSVRSCPDASKNDDEVPLAIKKKLSKVRPLLPDLISIYVTQPFIFVFLQTLDQSQALWITYGLTITTHKKLTKTTFY